MGKPDPTMIRGILHRHALAPENLAMVGDRLYTDILMAHRAGVLGVLVLTGEATALDATHHQPPPDLIVADISALGEKLKLAREGKP
jgi:NagD protein